MIALRSYVGRSDPTTEFERRLAEALKDAGIGFDEVGPIVERWDAVPAEVRARRYGPLAAKEHLGGVEPFDVAAQSRRRSRQVRVEATNPIVTPRGRVSAGEFDRGAGGASRDVQGEGAEEVPLIEYLVTYEGIHCIDETGPDWLASDEPYVVTSAIYIDAAGRNKEETVRHPFAGNGQGYYGNVDSGSTRVGPRAAVWLGTTHSVRVGVSFMTTFVEHTFGDEEEVKATIAKCVRIAQYVVATKYPTIGVVAELEEVREIVVDLVFALLELVGLADTIINEPTVVVFTFGELDEMSRTEPTPFLTQSGAYTNLRYHFIMSDDEKDYVAAYQIHRTPPLPPLGPVLL
ncbi:hypothetical protein [Microbacterium immunditiarum]|uniref:Uncharacterized protein n=1 Tax=Microbacterium immunditiarum TaxID=337480 RepID=A0A7Y9GPA6_9MICO|nr:hypothetical protein [Microbacterium immunditiarum]NYE20146.1 hypothetical protein [Microbacterium immunditiarum]